MNDQSTIVTECVKCQRPLGADSRDAGIIVCQEHRRCFSCGLPVSPTEITWCIDRTIPIKHARCMVLSDSPHTADHNDPLMVIDVVNMCTLLFTTPELPERLIANMDFEQRYGFMKMLQSLSARVSVLLIKDKKHFEADVRDKRTEEIRNKAEKRMSAGDRASRTARQLGIPAANGKIARKKLSNLEKAVEAQLPFAMLSGMFKTEAEAREHLTKNVKDKMV